MKKLLSMFAFAAGLASLSACSESEYDIPNLIPDEYNKILYILDNGEHEVTLYKTGENTPFHYAVVKAGSEPTLEAGVNMRVLSQAEVDAKWSTLTGIPHYVIPTSSYTVGEANLKFTSKDAFQNLNFEIIPEEVEVFIEEKKASDPANANYMKFVLPFLAEGATKADSVNSMKNYVMVTVTNILEPVVGFQDTGVQEQFIGQGNATINIPVNLDVTNQWDFTSGVVVDEAYIAAYNTANGTNYQPFPASAITVPETVNFTSGSQATLGVQVNFADLEKNPTMDKKYMLALKLEKGEMFGISEAKSRYLLATTYRMPDRKNWEWKANSESSQEGTNGWVTNVYDDNLNTYWHSNYGSGNGVVNKLPYIFTIDMKEAKTVCSFGLYGRQHASNSDLKAGFFEVSNDGVSWTQVGTFSVVKGIVPETICPITLSTVRYLRVTMTESHRSQNGGIAEIYVYGY